MITEIKNNIIHAKCPNCGNAFTIPMQNLDSNLLIIMQQVAETMHCDTCNFKRIGAIERDERQMARERRVDAVLANSVLPTRFIGMKEPYVPYVADWIWENRNQNLWISGESGTGKTSSACFIAEQMIRNELTKVRYYDTFDTLKAEYVAAKTGNSQSAHAREAQFWHRLRTVTDLLIIDEQIGQGDYVKLTASGTELFFQLINGVYDCTHRGRVWILGNFFHGALEEMIGTKAEPIKRRIKDSFVMGTIKNQRIIKSHNRSNVQ